MVQAAYVATPRVTLNIVPRDQVLGLQEQRALFVGQVAPAVRASGKVTFTGQPTASDTITLNGTAWTFVGSGPSGNQILIGASLALTLAAAATALNASVETQTVLCTYYVVGNALLIVKDIGGTSGNSYTLAKSGTTMAVSAATLTGGAAAPGSAATGGLVTDLPRTPAEMNALFGVGSHLAVLANAFRSVNEITVADALPLADAAGSAQAASQLLFAGSATAAGTLYVTVCDDVDHTYQIDVVAGDTPTTLLPKLTALIDADLDRPFIYDTDGVGTIQFRARNGGTYANGWLIKVKGSAAGIAMTLTGWANGTSNPSLTTLFDPIESLRYQTVVWPEVYTLSKIATFLDGRKNVNNDVMEGRAFTYHSVVLATAKSDALGVNSSEVVLINNEPVSSATWIGPHIPACPDVIAAKFAAARARRYEEGISISDIVATNEPLDQFGGDDKVSLPYFNTPILGVGRPAVGAGYTQAEQLEAEAHGVTVVGLNRSQTAVVMGPVVSTWLADTAGNPDDTWKYLEWRDTHGAIREYQVINLRKRFAQYRMSIGDAVPNYAMVNEAMIRGQILAYCEDGMNKTWIIKGQASRQYIQDNLTVTLDPANRSVSIAEKVPIVSQLENIIGAIKFVFTLN